MSGMGPEIQEADKRPRRLSLSLRPQDARLIEGMAVGSDISVSVRGEITGVSMNEYGAGLDVDVTSIAIQKPEPAKFVDQIAEGVKTLTS